MTHSEEWRTIAGFNGYYLVSSVGRIKSIDRYVKKPHTGDQFVKGRILRIRKNRYGYPVITLNYLGARTHLTVHRLVAKAFIPNPQLLPVINHKNAIKHDNAIDNLEWCTSAYNAQHALKNNLSPVYVSETHPNKKLCAEDIHAIIRMYKSGMYQKDIGIRFSISQANIHLIVTGKSWWQVSKIDRPAHLSSRERKERAAKRALIYGLD